MVVVEERGNPAGLRQAPWERRSRERGRAAPRGRELMCWTAPKPQVFIGEREGAAPPLGFHPRGGGQPPDGTKGGGQGEERGGAPLDGP